MSEQQKVDYITHLIECKCILPILENITPVVYHKFPVVSLIKGEDAQLVPHFDQCNNCGQIYKITEIGTAELQPKENSKSIDTIEDFELQLPQNLINVLRKQDCELYIWKQIKYIIEYKLWNRFVVLSRERDEQNSNVVHGKILHIFGESLFKLESFTEENAGNIVSNV